MATVATRLLRLPRSSGSLRWVSNVAIATQRLCYGTQAVQMFSEDGRGAQSSNAAHPAGGVRSGIRRFSAQAAPNKAGGSGVGLFGTAVAAPPTLCLALALQSQVDPDGFRTTTDLLFPDTVSKKLQQWALGDSPEVEQAAPAVKKDAGAGSPRRVGAVAPPELDRPDVTWEGQRAAREHEAMVKEAARVYLENAERAAEEERMRRAQVEKTLRMELEQLEAEAKRLKDENEALKVDAANREAARLPPQVVFQEIRLTDELREKLEDLQAAKTAERIAQLLQQPMLGDEASHSRTSSIDERGLDPSKEAVLAAGASLEAVQKRIKELLIELDCRTRLEGIRLREAIMQTEENARVEHLHMLGKQLAAQEKELQRLMAIQVEEIQKRAAAEVARRDAAWEAKIRDEWDRVNQRSEEFARVEGRVKEMQQIMERLDLLEQDKKALAKSFQEAANERIKKAEHMYLESQAAGGVLAEVGEERQMSVNIRGLALAAMAAVGALDQKRALVDELLALKDVARGDQVVATAFSSIPSGVAESGVASANDLFKSFSTGVKLARRALLVPQDGGFVSEVAATVQVPFLSSFNDASLPAGDASPELPLRRAKYWVDRGQYDKALEELKVLDPRALRVMSTWMEEARKRLLVEQALRLIRSHALAELSRYS